MLFHNLNKYEDQTALIEENGNKITYTQLNKMVSEFQLKLPKTRQLIFLQVKNSLLSIIAYIPMCKSDLTKNK